MKDAVATIDGHALSVADLQRAKALGDSSGALLEAKFQIRTYVKTASPEGSSGT